ncbi:Rha family transcriptional regulator [Rubrivivax gelatinosus]|uniref:Rha family phage regulatory protein n=1 Tax=Rubrivivax gelatinosus TaxID=28068 RepID=A0A4R2MR45_RUBGE|nr:Rha family transcriptional regulator [Rubrivivax gelatinosus]TCP05676.1 Rha family phage regulatory protein [Rubrivivax gelatinosus]
MADTPLIATAEVALPLLRIADGQATATSLQIAEHFGKRHGDVIRAVRKLDCPPEFSRRNFASAKYLDEQGKPRDCYHVTRDGFSLLAMGFTGKEAMRWKLAYIAAFNAMEAQLRALYVAPLVCEKEFRDGIKLRDKLVLMEQSHKTMRQLRAEADPAVQRNLYWQLRQINETLGIPTEAAGTLLGAAAPALLAGQEGGAQ